MDRLHQHIYWQLKQLENYLLTLNEILLVDVSIRVVDVIIGIVEWSVPTFKKTQLIDSFNH